MCLLLFERMVHEIYVTHKYDSHDLNKFTGDRNHFIGAVDLDKSPIISKVTSNNYLIILTYWDSFVSNLCSTFFAKVTRTSSFL